MIEVCAVQHIHFEHLGTLEPILRDHECQIHYYDAGIDDLSKIDPLAAKLLVVLGGPIGAYQEDAYPCLRDELKLIEARLKGGLATLGICLGAQLIARALGARVYAGSKKEIGWAPIELTDTGKETCLAALGEENLAVLHWHGDTFDLPEGAKRLASTPAFENQAFLWGDNILALQFHAEILAEDIERWLIGHAVEIAAVLGTSVPQIRADTFRYGRALERAGSKCFSRWLKEIGL